MRAKKRDRYYVPDLTPRDRAELHGVGFRYVFIAESPHISEIEPDRKSDRRPLCGAAGKVWWNALSEELEGAPSSDVSLERFLLICRKHRVAVMNAVQYPLDPKILKHVKDASADPQVTIGFSKAPGASHFKKVQGAARQEALRDLRERILDPGLDGARIVVLGNDADWFVRHALTEQEFERRADRKIAHPSAWWRRGGYFGKEARKSLKTLFARAT